MLKLYRRLRSGLGMVVLFLLVTAASSAFAGDTSTDSLAFSTPSSSDVVLPELDEFATNVLGSAWDMKESTDLAFYRSDSRFANSNFGSGLYSAQMINGQGGERITLLTVGARDNTAMRVGKIGYNYPINADHYRYLTFRVWRSNSEENSGVVHWYTEDSQTTEVMGVSKGFAVGPGSGWETYVLDLATHGIQAGEKDWSGIIRELVIHPYAGAGAAGSTMKLDWARLTHEDPRTARPFRISWTGSNGKAITLHASRDDKILDENDILLATGVTDSSFTWETGVVEAGTYYIAISDGTKTTWSEGAVILHSPPQITITKPSPASGDDYAEVVLRNAWDMEDVSDLNSQTPTWWESCVANESFTGVYRANLTTCSSTNTHIDPKLYLGHLKGTSGIDTSKYRYLSFKLSHSGMQSVADGWVARLGWWRVDNNNQVVEDVVMGRDIMLSEGKQLYSVDLWSHDVVDERHPVQRSWRDSTPNRLRFDPSELNKDLLPASIELDWIRLTAMDGVQKGGAFNIEFETINVETSDVTIYYDTDSRLANDSHIIDTIRVAPTTTRAGEIADTSAAPVSNAPLSSLETTADSIIYLPLAMDDYTRCSGACVRWDTSDVPAGEYYICAEISDRYNSTYTCSETPVSVK